MEGCCLESELGRATECVGQRSCRSSCPGAGLDMIRGTFIEGAGGVDIQGSKDFIGSPSPGLEESLDSSVLL